MTLLVLNGCGPSSVSHHQLCPLITGTFAARSDLESTEGSCGKAKEISFDSYEFDSEGAFVSHLDPIVRCRTVQDDCNIAVHCSTDVIDAKADFNGTLARDGSRLTGTATFSGQYQGCTRVVYQVVGKLAGERRVEAARPSPPAQDTLSCSSKSPKLCDAPINLP